MMNSRLVSGMGPRRGSRPSAKRVCLLVAAVCAVSIWLFLVFLVISDSGRRSAWKTIVGWWEPSPRLTYAIHAYNHLGQAYRASLPGLDYSAASSSSSSSSSAAAAAAGEGTQGQVVEPTYFKLGDLLADWSPHLVAPEKWAASRAHPDRGQGVIRLDYQNADDFQLALQYRNAEIPFILYNYPPLAETAGEYFSIEALLHNFGRMPREVSSSQDNHFMYYTAKNLKESILNTGWRPPQDETLLSFAQYLELVEAADALGPNMQNVSLHYLTVSAAEGWRTPWIREALPFFNPQSSFFIADPEGFRGINCRFGMKGVIAAAHYDGGRNFVAMVRGRKRYVLLAPRECPNLDLYPRGHPSARHSKIDWADIEQVRNHPQIFNAPATEVVVAQGELLYIPSYWFHYIVSQDASIQCNSRSGSSSIGREEIEDCGFYSASAHHDKEADDGRYHPVRHRPSKANIITEWANQET